jgi:hypothetical protein
MLRELAMDVEGPTELGCSSPLSCDSGIGGVGDPVLTPSILIGSPLLPNDEGRVYDVDGEEDVRMPAPRNGGVPGLPLIAVPVSATIPAGLLSKLCNRGLDSP